MNNRSAIKKLLLTALLSTLLLCTPVFAFAQEATPETNEVVLIPTAPLGLPLGILLLGVLAVLIVGIAMITREQARFNK